LGFFLGFKRGGRRGFDAEGAEMILGEMGVLGFKRGGRRGFDAEGAEMILGEMGV